LVQLLDKIIVNLIICKLDLWLIAPLLATTQMPYALESAAGYGPRTAPTWGGPPYKMPRR
jgi:hypothetical protein